MLEDLLERVRPKSAPTRASSRPIASARAAIAGFFSRQAYEVFVEPVDAAHVQAAGGARRCSTAPRRHPSTATPATILDLADAVSDDERNDVIDLVDEHAVSTESRDFADSPRPVQPLDRSRPPTRRSSATPWRCRTSPTGPVTKLDGRRSTSSPSRPTSRMRPCHRRRRIVLTAAGFPPAIDPRPGTPRSSALNEVIDRYETQLVAARSPRPAHPARCRADRAEGRARRVAGAPPRAADGSRRSRRGDRRRRCQPRRRCTWRATSPIELHLDPDDVVLATRDQLGDGIPAWLQMNDPEHRARAPAQLATPRPADDRRVQPSADVPVAAVGARDARPSRADDHLGDRRRGLEARRHRHIASTRSAASTCSRSTTSTTP